MYNTVYNNLPTLSNSTEETKKYKYKNVIKNIKGPCGVVLVKNTFSRNTSQQIGNY